MNTDSTGTSAMAYFDQMAADADFSQNPHPAYDWVREQGPLWFSELWQCWVTARFDVAVEIADDSEHFGNSGRATAFIDQLEDQEVRAAIAPLYDHFAVGLINSDPPDHTRLRRILSKAFTPRVVRELAPRVATIVDQLLDTMIADQNTDLVSGLSYPLPATVIAEMLGVPEDQHDLFKLWSDNIVSFFGNVPPRADAALLANQTVAEARPWIRDLVAARRKDPQDDLITALAHANDEGGALSEAEMLSTCMTLLVAGHDTTTSLISSCIRELGRRAGDPREVTNDDEQLRHWTEEALRYHSPLQRQMRICRSDQEIQGVQIAKGQRVETLLGGANRDPRVFNSPHTFDHTRAEKRHLGFGRGIHFCIGAPLSRMEAPIAVTRIVDRLDGVRVLDEPRWREDSFVQSLATLNVDLSLASSSR